MESTGKRLPSWGIKKIEARAVIDTALALATVDTITYRDAYKVFKKNVPEEHIGQLLHKIFSRQVCDLRFRSKNWNFFHGGH